MGNFRSPVSWYGESCSWIENKKKPVVWPPVIFCSQSAGNPTRAAPFRDDIRAEKSVQDIFFCILVRLHALEWRINRHRGNRHPNLRYEISVRMHWLIWEYWCYEERTLPIMMCYYYTKKELLIELICKCFQCIVLIKTVIDSDSDSDRIYSTKYTSTISGSHEFLRNTNNTIVLINKQL